MNARMLFNTSAAIEFLAGIGLLVMPAAAAGLLPGDGLNESGFALARILGIGLLSLGISTWEAADVPVRITTRMGLTTYNLGAAAFLAVVGLSGATIGALVWPAFGLHALLGAAMLIILLK
jgi:hypothetical protein